jgi:hypothetical protein
VSNFTTRTLLAVGRIGNNGTKWNVLIDPTTTRGSVLAGQLGDQLFYDLALAIAPADATVVFLGGVNALESGNAGLTWRLITKSQPNGNFVTHTDHHAWAFSDGGLPRTPVAYDGNDGGIYKFRSSNSTWTSMNTAGLGTILVLGVAARTQPDGSIVYLEGSQDNGLTRWVNTAGNNVSALSEKT